ncbi:hypothetical protein IT414_02800 [bacterium]|nr:hypothetical protein [bacterium]
MTGVWRNGAGVFSSGEPAAFGAEIIDDPFLAAANQADDASEDAINHFLGFAVVAHAYSLCQGSRPGA